MAELTTVNALRLRATELIAAAGDNNKSVAEEYRSVIQQFLAAGGSSKEMIVMIGEQFFPDPEVKRSAGPKDDDPLQGSRRLDFDYLEQFMIDCFLAVGVPEKV